MNTVDVTEVRRIESELVEIYKTGNPDDTPDDLESVDCKPDNFGGRRHLIFTRLVEMGMPHDLLERATDRVMRKLGWI